MSAADNEQLIRRFYDECWNTGNTAAIDAFVAPAYQAQYLDTMRATHAAFPGLRWVLDEMVAEGDTVAVRWTLQGTQRGDYLGIAPTGNRVNWPGATFFHLAGGKIADRTVHADPGALRQQLGASS